jgi:hypothetical protein
MRSLGPEVDTDIGSREGSTSPTSRKRKKIRRRSIDTNNVGKLSPASPVPRLFAAN